MIEIGFGYDLVDKGEKLLLVKEYCYDSLIFNGFEVSAISIN